MFKWHTRAFLAAGSAALLALFALAMGGGSPWEMVTVRVWQAEGGNRAVARFLKSLPVSYRSDTVYLFLVDPMRAPRLEGTINAFIHLLRRAGVRSDIITLVVAEKKRAAQRYIERRGFASDHTFVVGNEILNSFVFNWGEFGPMFVAKFSVHTGQLLSSYALNVVDSATVAWFIADTSKPTARKPPSASQPKSRIKTERFQPRCAKILKLESDDEHPLSTANYLSLSPDGKWLSFNDKLTNFIYIFHLNTGNLKGVLFPDSSEERMYCRGMPEDVYQFMRQCNMTVYMGNWFFDDSTLLISASLPMVKRIFWEGDSDYGFYNVPCLLRKRFFDNTLLGCDSIRSLPDTIPIGFDHSSASFVPETGLLFFRYTRGWPKGHLTLSERVPPEDNPFSDEFYRRHLYLFAAYRPSGEFAGMWGRLNDRRRHLRLGYFWKGAGVVRFWDGKYYSSDGRSGLVYVYNENGSLLDSLRLFDEAEPVIPDVDRSKEPELYLSEALKLNFPAEVEDICVTDNHLYALIVYHESQPLVYKVGLKDHTRKVYGLPAVFRGKKAKHYLLRNTETGVRTVTLLESGDDTWYCEFQLP